MQTSDDRRAEFIIHKTGKKKIHAFPHGRKVKSAGVSRRFCVTPPRILDVHRHIIDEACLHDGPEPVRERAVRVELYRVAESPHVTQKVFQTGLQKRFSAGDADAVEHTAPLFQVGEHFAFRNLVRERRPQHEGSIVAEGAAKIAPSGKNGAGYLFRVIEQRELLQPADFQKTALRLAKRKQCRAQCRRGGKGSSNTICWIYYSTSAQNAQ